MAKVFKVLITFGNAVKTYSTSPNRKEAEAMKRTALSLKYRDARIVEADDEENGPEYSPTDRYSETIPHRPHQKAP